MRHYIFFLSVLLSTCHADYTIRTRHGSDKVVLAEDSPMVISTIAVPPYVSTFFNGSEGLIVDLLKILQENGGLPPEFDLQVTKEPTPGSLEKNNYTGIIEDAHLKYTHFATGPIYNNIFLEKFYFSVPWHTPQLKLVVRTDSALAHKALRHEDNLDENLLDVSSVDLIFVDKSAELQALLDFSIMVPPGLVSIQEELTRKSPIIVDNICDGLRQLNVIDHSDKPVKTKSPNLQKALVLNSLEADHYASGNEMLKIISPLYPSGDGTTLQSFSFMSHLSFNKMSFNLGHVIGKNGKKIDEIVKRWSKYDKDACSRLRISLSGVAPLESTSVLYLASLILTIILAAMK